MAFTKKQKDQMLEQYKTWLNDSRAVFMLEYTRMNVKLVEQLRAKVREAGGEAHVIKNTLMTKALNDAGMPLDGELENTTFAGFAFEDAPGMAKVFNEAVKDHVDVFQLKMGYLGGVPISIDQIKALADLPPLPVMRSMLLGVLQAPASKLVRTVAEPARQLARVFQSYAEESVPTEG